ncbi:hypothetical protein [Nocardioides solisilvae]|uniref:hypothetical protein n=1 Tax=Nocardioides solisilvae TaxID=1542435 RepID=UPI000D748083|nr:hypothetical protein [Nocardioides solisilvae]
MKKSIARLSTLALAATLTAVVAPAQAAPSGSDQADPRRFELNTRGLRNNFPAFVADAVASTAPAAATTTFVDGAGTATPGSPLAFSADRALVLEGGTLHQGDVAYTAGSPAGEAVAADVRAWVLASFAGVARPAPGAGAALVEASDPRRLAAKQDAEIQADPDVTGVISFEAIPGTDNQKVVFVITDVDPGAAGQVATVTEFHLTEQGISNPETVVTVLDRVVVGETVPVGQPAAKRIHDYTYGPNGAVPVDPALFVAGETYDQVAATTAANAGFPAAVKKLRKQVAKKARKKGPKKARKVLVRKAKAWDRRDDPAGLRNAKVRKGRATLRVANPFTGTQRVAKVTVKGRKVTASKVRKRKL